MARSVPVNDARSEMTIAVRLDALLSGLVATTFFVRFFLPTEATAQGDTLWIVGLWLVIAVASMLTMWNRSGVFRQPDWLDGSVLLMVGGQALSAVVVVLTSSGDRRAAVNVAWEWFGVSIVWFIMRSRMASPSFRREFVRASMITGFVLAGLGVWQHYIALPNLAAEYGPLFDQFRTASGPERDVVQRKLSEAGIPTDGPGLTLFEKRLRDSREPMGLFGLANTFGGCLAVWMVMFLSELFTALRGRGHTRVGLILLLFSVGLIAWCLLLTKSRTAWAGTGCGALLLGAGRLVTAIRTRRAIRFLGLGIVVVVIAIGGLSRIGGLDRQVLSEAPKSLEYRLQYWRATSQLVVDHLWFGVGPGNFRQHYLTYKLPEASEEIADPHNLFLDVTATGGIVSMLGLVLLIGLALSARGCGARPAISNVGRESLHEVKTGAAISVSSWRMLPASEPTLAASPTTAIAAPVPRRPTSADVAQFTHWFAGLSPLLAFFSLLTFSGSWEDRLLVLTCVWFGLAWVWKHLANCDVADEAGPGPTRMAFAAFVALTVHLLGAGGIAMPAISQLLLVLIVLSLPVETASVRPLPRSSALCFFSTSAIGWALTATTFVWTALVPVTRSQWWQSRGDRSLSSINDRSAAEAAYRSAAKSDDWLAEPWRRRAEMAFEQASADRFRSNESFDAAVVLLLEAIHRDPNNYQGLRTLGNWWLMRWRATRRVDDARQAADWLTKASRLYPTNPSLLAELAIGLNSAGQRAEAATVARQALTQDKLNRRLGHVDRFLTDDVITQLRSMTDETRPAAPPP